MKYRIQIPGKTFCFGEYAALLGGPALLIATMPGFEMILKKAEAQTQNPFHLLSPGGKYFENNKDFFSDWQIDFVDHYQGRGGFGASTAQFLGLCYFKRHIFSDLPPENIHYGVWQEYRSINESLKPELKSNQQPSGYDLWSQMLGGVCLVRPTLDNNRARFQNTRLEWPFPELSFLIVPTGIKVPTHDHLNTLNLAAVNELVQKSQQLTAAWLEKNQNEFLNLLRNWGQTLAALDLVHSRAKEILTALSQHPEILAAKGCGALGADLLFLAFLPRDFDRVKTILGEMQLNEAYDQRNLWEHEIKVQAI